MNLYVYTHCHEDSKVFRQMYIGEESGAPDDGIGVYSPELEKYLNQLDVNSTECLPHQIVSLKFHDDEGSEWRIDPEWPVCSESGSSSYGVWSQLEIALQPAGGVS